MLELFESRLWQECDFSFSTALPENKSLWIYWNISLHRISSCSCWMKNISSAVLSHGTIFESFDEILWCFYFSSAYCCCELKGLPSLFGKSTCWISVLFPNNVSTGQHSGFVTQFLTNLSPYGWNWDLLVLAFLIFFSHKQFFLILLYFLSVDSTFWRLLFSWQLTETTKQHIWNAALWSSKLNRPSFGTKSNSWRFVWKILFIWMSMYFAREY